MLFKKYYKNPIEVKQNPKDADLIKYGLIKEVNFTIIVLKNG